MPSFQGHPSLRTARLVLPDTALQSVVSLPNWQYLMGLAEGFVCLYQAEKPTFLKVRIRPALMIRATAPSFAFAPASQNAAQTHSHPLIHCLQLPSPAVLEVVEPATQHRIDQLDGLFQRAPVVALELRTKLGP